MISEIKISVIIPTYNRSSTIEYCLKSVLTQTYQNFEIIVVDDCSTDNTIKIIGKLNDSRISIIKLAKNSGAQVARNVGIKNSKYDWIAFQDSDDEWLPDKLEKQIKELEKINFDKNYVIHGNCNVLNYENKQIVYWNLPLIKGKCYKQLLVAPAPVFPSILVSKEAIQKINFLDESVPSYQEWDTVIRLAKHCKFIHIQEPLFVYHKHENETISKDLLRDVIGYQYIIEKFKEEIISVCGYEVWQQHLKNQAQRFLSFNLFEKLSINTHEQDRILALLKDVMIEYGAIYSNSRLANDWQNKYLSLKKSTSFKIGSFLIKPFAYIKTKFQKSKNK